MSATAIAALLAAIGGLIGGIFTGIRSLRSDKFKQNVEAGAALLAGYTDMVATLRTELERVKDEQTEERAEWRKERDAMRREWQEERDRMRAQHTSEVADLNDRIDELSSQLYALTHRAQADGDRTRVDDQ